MRGQGTILALVALAFALVVSAAPTQTHLDVGFPIGRSLSLPDIRGSATSELHVRDPGEVQLWPSPNTLEKRISLGLYVVNLAVFGGFTQQTCAVFVAAPMPISGAICAASAFATLGYVLYSHWHVQTRDLAIDHPRGGFGKNLVFNIDHIQGKTATHAMALAYAATNGSEPVLVANHPCETSGCYNYHYQNYEHPTIGTVHKVTQKPRGHWGIQKSTKRQTYTDETASEDTVTESDGTIIYGTYIYWDTTPGDEGDLANENSSDDIADALYDSAVTNTAFENQGYYCVDITDESDDVGAVPTTGFFDVSEGENQSDPDDEQSYLTTCNDDALTENRRVKRATHHRRSVFT